MSPIDPFLTSRQFAESLGVSESSVKRWVDDGVISAHRTAGGHRRIPLSAAIGFIRRENVAIAKPGLLPLDATPRLGSVDGTAVDALHEALLHDRAGEARSIVTGRYVSGASIASIGDDLIRPVLARLGELWHSGPEGVLIEHRAVDSCVHVLAEISLWIPPVPESAPAAITAAGPQDPYLLPPMLAGLVLRECGVRTHNLGPNTPLEAIAVAMKRYRARLCSISVSAKPVAKSEATWLALADVISESGGRIVVGGRSIAELPARLRDRVQVCESMGELTTYTSGWLEGFRRTFQN